MTSKIAEDNFSISVSSIKTMKELATKIREEIDDLEESFNETGDSVSTLAILKDIKKHSLMFSRQARVLEMLFS